MQFSDSAGNFAGGAQFCTGKEFQSLCYSYVKFCWLLGTVVHNDVRLAEKNSLSH
jgi:hypothetical protein